MVAVAAAAGAAAHALVAEAGPDRDPLARGSSCGRASSSTRAAPWPKAHSVAARVAAVAMPATPGPRATQYPTSTTSLARSWRGKPELPTSRPSSTIVNWAAPAAQRAGAPSRTHHSASARV